MSDAQAQALTPAEAQALLMQAFPAARPRDPRQALFASLGNLAEIGFVLAGMTFFGTDMAKMLFGSDTASAENPAIVRILYMAFYAASGLLLLKQGPALVQRIMASPLMLAVILFPVASVLWSVDRGETLNRSVASLGTSVFGVYLITRFSLRDIVILAALAFSVIAALDLFFAVFMPGIGRMVDTEWAGVWRGLHLHKNNLGAVSAIGAITIIFGLMTARGPIRAVYCIGLALCLTLLVGSKSTSALLNFLMIASLIVWARMARRAPALVWSITIVGGVALAAILIQIVVTGAYQAIFEMLGKNAEMSGRFPLWQLAWTYVQQRFWLGFGYAAFWSESTAEVKRIAMILHYVPYYSHNGVLETFLNGGVTLMLLFGAAFSAMVWRAAIFLHRCPVSSLAAFPLMFCFYFIYGNFAESKILARNDLIWVLFVALALFLASVMRASPGKTRA